MWLGTRFTDGNTPTLSPQRLKVIGGCTQATAQSGCESENEFSVLWCTEIELSTFLFIFWPEGCMCLLLLIKLGGCGRFIACICLKTQMNTSTKSKFAGSHERRTRGEIGQLKKVALVVSFFASVRWLDVENQLACCVRSSERNHLVSSDWFPLFIHSYSLADRWMNKEKPDIHFWLD